MWPSDRGGCLRTGSAAGNLAVLVEKRVYAEQSLVVGRSTTLRLQVRNQSRGAAPVLRTWIIEGALQKSERARFKAGALEALPD